MISKFGLLRNFRLSTLVRHQMTSPSPAAATSTAATACKIEKPTKDAQQLVVKSAQSLYFMN
jgi:hypothetical protein